MQSGLTHKFEDSNQNLPQNSLHNCTLELDILETKIQLKTGLRISINYCTINRKYLISIGGETIKLGESCFKVFYFLGINYGSVQSIDKIILGGLSNDDTCSDFESNTVVKYIERWNSKVKNLFPQLKIQNTHGVGYHIGELDSQLIYEKSGKIKISYNVKLFLFEIAGRALIKIRFGRERNNLFLQLVERSPGVALSPHAVAISTIRKKLQEHELDTLFFLQRHGELWYSLQVRTNNIKGTNEQVNDLLECSNISLPSDTKIEKNTVLSQEQIFNISAIYISKVLGKKIEVKQKNKIPIITIYGGGIAWEVSKNSFLAFCRIIIEENGGNAPYLPDNRQDMSRWNSRLPREVTDVLSIQKQKGLGYYIGGYSSEKLDLANKRDISQYDYPTFSNMLQYGEAMIAYLISNHNVTNLRGKDW